MPNGSLPGMLLSSPASDGFVVLYCGPVMTRYYAQLKVSGHRYDRCGHSHNSVSAAVDCIVDCSGECESYVVASDPFAKDRELNTDETILFELALQSRLSPRVDEALRRLEKIVA
jgi:hypothetical protein